MIRTIEQALDYINQEEEGIYRDALTHRELATEYFVWETNKRSKDGDRMLIEAVNKHEHQVDRSAMIRLDRQGQMRGLTSRHRARHAAFYIAEDLAWLLLGAMLLVGVFVLLGYFLLPHLPQAVR